MLNKLDNFLEFALYLADEAAQISGKYFRGSFTVASKIDQSPVTIADREIELRLRELIKQYYPEHGVSGEEFADQITNSAYCWVIDPIDGTIAFACGKPLFTTLIALLHHGKPRLSVIDQPILGERYSALCGAGAFLKDRQEIQIHSNKQLQLSSARLNATTPTMFNAKESFHFARLAQAVQMVSFGGDAYAYAQLAAGHIDIIMESSLHYYDIAALIPLIEESGGIISDWQGKPLSQDFNGQVLACANLELQRQALKVINQTSTAQI